MATAQSRLRAAKYEAPNGDSMAFSFRDLSKTIPKKTHAHETRSVQGTYHEDHGIRGRQYPVRVIISGVDHDILADRFENLLVQSGRGVLTHPVYGDRKVVITGTIERSDPLATAGGLTTFDVLFSESTLAGFAIDTDPTLASIDVAIASLALPRGFDRSIRLTAPASKASFLQTMRSLAAGAKKAIRRAADGSQALTSKMTAIDRSLQAALTTGVGTPLLIAVQMKTLIGAPARSLALLSDRLAAYGDLAASIFAGEGAGSGGGTGSSAIGPGIVAPSAMGFGIGESIANAFHANRMVAESAVYAMSSSVAAGTYSTRSQAFAAVEQLAATVADFRDWSDANWQALAAAEQLDTAGAGVYDDGESLQALLSLAGQSAALVFGGDYAAILSRRLLRPRNIIDLCIDLNGDLSGLDDFIALNQFRGREIVAGLPAGRSVSWVRRG